MAYLENGEILFRFEPGRLVERDTLNERGFVVMRGGVISGHIALCADAIDAAHKPPVSNGKNFEVDHTDISPIPHYAQGAGNDAVINSLYE
jgi:hypothetical protein